MDRTTALWALVVFFGASVVFAGINRLTDGEPALVVAGAQLAGLAAVILVVWLLVKRQR